MGQRAFVSFDECKTKIPIPDVLSDLGLVDRFKERNGALIGCCPFPSHIHGPSPNPEQFRINQVEGVWLWRCWGDCKASGNVVQFVMRMTGLSAEHVRFWFAEHFGDRLGVRSGGENHLATGVSETKEAGGVLRKPQPAVQSSTKVRVSSDLGDYKPIRFRLQVNPKAQYLQDRGVTEETATQYGIGLASKGMLAGYIAIPIWDFPKGDFPVGYIGRWPGEDYDAGQGRPRYKLPTNFPKQRCFFGINEALREASDQPLVVVEGIFGALHCIQSGFGSTIAALGSSLSDEQVELLVRSHRPIVLMFDGDESGRSGMEAGATRLLPHTFVRLIGLADGQQPDQIASNDLRHVLSF